MKSYLRFLSRNKLYTAIMAVGLSVALTFVLLTGTFVWQQYSVSRNVKDSDRIWTVGKENFGFKSTSMYLGAADVMKEHIPEIEIAGSYSDMRMDIISLDGVKMHSSGVGVDMGFFQIFEPEFISGSYDVLNDMSNAIVSETFAKANGGIEGVIGKKIGYDGYEFTISAVMADFVNSLFPYSDIVININSELNASRKQYKHICETIPFVKVREGVIRDEIIAKLEAEVERMVKEDIAILPYEGSLVLNYQEILFSDYITHLNKTDKKSLRMMLLVVIFLLVSAIINFVNLNAAMSTKRIKEMAARMVLGTGRSNIYIKYILESVLLCLFCGVIAILAAIALEPYMNGLLKSDIPIKIIISPASILLYMTVVSATGVVASILPASIGISINPMDILKGKARKNNKRIFSKIFIGFQSAVSIVMIALAIIMELQMKHLTERPVGADIDDLYYLYVDDLRDCSTIEKALRELPFVEEIGISEGYPGKSSEVITLTKENEKVIYGMIRCDSTAFSLYNFQRKTNLTSSIYNTIWMTQSNLDASGIDPESPETFRKLPTAAKNVSFGGIVEEYAAFDVLKDMYGAIGFIQVFSTSGFSPFMSRGGGLLIKTTGDRDENRKIIEDTYRKHIEETNGIYTEPYEYGYIRDLHRDKLEEVNNNMRLMELFMFLAILLSFMGLVAMSRYYSSENISDIAIRKVYGSTIGNETVGSIWMYTKIVLVSCIGAVPVAVIAGRRYLEGFVYRVDNHWWVYALAVLLALLISLAAVFVQISRAARTNPAEALKKE
jgi:putative ABC transport system permease protein